MEEQKFKFPTEMVDLPSKGLIYPEDSPLSKGKIEMKYMTAREEDILTNHAYIKQGVVLDKMLQSLIVTKINYDDLIVGDKNALFIAARVLGYGGNYAFDYDGQSHTVDLSTLNNKEFDESLITKGVNEFHFTLPYSETKITFKILTSADEKKIEKELNGLKQIGKDYSFNYAGEEITIDLSKVENKLFNETQITKGINEFLYTLPHSNNKITFKILTGNDETNIDKEIEGLKKINKDFSPELSTRLKYIITSVGGDKDEKTIREFVDNYLLARDSRALREYIKNIQPDVDLSYTLSSGAEVTIPISLTFFWPDA